MWARIKRSLGQRQPSIGGALIVFGVTYQIMNVLLWGWWDVGIILSIPTFEQQIALTLGFLAYPLFVLSFSLAAIGVALIVKQEQEAKPSPSNPLRERLKAHKRITIGIILTPFGFTYQVIGAWVLWDKPYPWVWQTEIAKYGDLLVWLLFILSLISLIVGATLLYQNSKLHQKGI
jgi:ABC-type transport system involved in multi-copper enzyme maturation permease subunit